LVLKENILNASQNHQGTCLGELLGKALDLPSESRDFIPDVAVRLRLREQDGVLERLNLLPLAQAEVLEPLDLANEIAVSH
jgi:hypothetical protein